MEMSKLFSFAIIPAFIIGPIAGVYIDRWDRRTTLFISYFIQGILDFVGCFLSDPFAFHLADVCGGICDFFFKPFLYTGQNVLYPGDSP